MGERVVTLNEALRVLADFHTRDDAVTGFVVETHPRSFDASFWTQADYIQAWKLVRERLHMQTEPDRK